MRISHTHTRAQTITQSVTKPTHPPQTVTTPPSLSIQTVICKRAPGTTTHLPPSRSRLETTFKRPLLRDIEPGPGLELKVAHFSPAACVCVLVCKRTPWEPRCKRCHATVWRRSRMLYNPRPSVCLLLVFFPSFLQPLKTRRRRHLPSSFTFPVSVVSFTLHTHTHTHTVHTFHCTFPAS